MKTVFIYTLSDPITNDIKYIGKATDLDIRLDKHIKLGKENIGKNSNKRVSWIKSLLKKGLEPKMEILDEVPEQEWKFWETYWIWQFLTWGFKLKNGTYGGDGCNGFTPDVCKKLSLLNTGEKNPMYGKTHTKEAREKISKGNLGKKYTKEVREKISKSKMGHIVTDKTRTKISNELKGNKNALGHTLSEDAKNRIIIKLTGRKNPTASAKLKGNKNAIGKHNISLESKQKMINAHKGKKQNESTIEKRKESLKKYWANVKAGNIKR